MAYLLPERSRGKAPWPRSPPSPQRSWGRAGRNAAETIGTATGAALMWSQEVPAHCPSQVSRLARPSGVGSVCSIACWGRRFEGELSLKISQLPEVSLALVPMTMWGLRTWLFPSCSSGKTDASISNSLWAGVQETSQRQQETLGKMLGRDETSVSGFQNSGMETFFIF